MKKLFVSVALLILPGLASASGYQACLLEHLPGVQNAAARHAAVQLCQSKHGNNWGAAGSGRGFFAAYSSGAECTLDKARDTRDHVAAQMIGGACRFLYNEPPKPAQGLFDDIPRPSAARQECDKTTPGPWCEYR